MAGNPSVPLPLIPAAVRLKLAVFGITLPVVIILDLVTKSWALEALAFQRGELFGGLVPLTLAFNKGAAFGISVGEDSRWLFVPVTFVALGLLAVLFRQAEDRDLLRIGAISLVVAGALGNLYDRLRWDRGVVDFIGPIDLGFWYFPIFNVADMAISCGAVMLAISFWMEERQEEALATAGGQVATAGGEAPPDVLGGPGPADERSGPPRQG